MAKTDDKAADKSEENPEPAEGEQEGGGKKSKKKLLLIAAAVGGVLLLGGGTAAGLYFAGIIGGKHAESGQDAHEAANAEDASKAKETKSTFFQLGDILVNLSGEGKRPNYLKLKIAIELAEEKDVAVMESIKPRIIDNFQVYLRELRVDDLRGSAGLYRLREELLLRVTEAAQPVRVRDVLFQEMLVQ